MSGPSSRSRGLVALCALAPLIALPASAALAFAGLAVLVWSFCVDVAWLVRHARA